MLSFLVGCGTYRLLRPRWLGSLLQYIFVTCSNVLGGFHLNSISNRVVYRTLSCSSLDSPFVFNLTFLLLVLEVLADDAPSDAYYMGPGGTNCPGNDALVNVS